MKPPPNPPPAPSEDDPGVPGFRTWRGLYVFVLVAFVVMVVLLTVFSLAFR
jgi:hypothetical protein